jgi:hypothetical protein
MTGSPCWGWKVYLELVDPITDELLDRRQVARIDRQGRIRSLKTRRILKEL